MDIMMNRCRAFAEGVVVMVCPVLLALALKKVNLKSEKHGPAFPIVMLVIAGFTLISGICPVLACCLYEGFPTAGVIPTPVTRHLTPFSSAVLLVLACLIAQLIIPKSFVITIGFLFGPCIVIRMFWYYYVEQEVEEKNGRATPQQRDEEQNGRATPQQQDEAQNNNAIAQNEAEGEFYSKLDNSLEFLSGVTGILFLGLEGLALEGQISSSQGISPRLWRPMATSFVACAFGVLFMFVEMIPPVAYTTRRNALFIVILDVCMALLAIAVLVVIMTELMGRLAFVLFGPAFLIFMHLVFEQRPGGSDKKNSEPASLELTKVTFTGFLAVSIATISSGSPNMWTNWFLLFAAGAIISGLAWRLLTHVKSKTTVGSANVASSFTLITVKTANIASFITHFCVAIATILFAVMAWKALS